MPGGAGPRTSPDSSLYYSISKSGAGNSWLFISKSGAGNSGTIGKVLDESERRTERDSDTQPNSGTIGDVQ
eukprot:767660-Hanusia_phi.AAC.9